MKIGILTGGGDVPGLNSCIKAVVKRASDEGHTVLGIRRGWAGLLNYNPDDETGISTCVTDLDNNIVRTVDRTGGTFLHTSRINPGRVHIDDLPQFLRETEGPQKEVRDCTDHILKNIERLGIEALIPIGGDDTLNYAYRLHNEGVPILAIPKTMDNDVYGTDYCIGFSTAITRSIDMIHNLRTSIGSHERIGVIELFGRNSGETSLIAAYLADVDRAVISEVPFDPEKLATLLAADKHKNPSNYAILTISEGATMIGGKNMKYGQPDAASQKLSGIGAVMGEAIKQITGESIIYQQIAYLSRSGKPDSIDLMVGFNFANMVMDLVGSHQLGQMVAVKDGKYTSIPASVLAQGIKRVDVDELYDVDAYRPKVRHVREKPMFLY
ncbi:MAG: 6-phosphofructokinase [Anaerolineaceae bacterium]|nr:6-phosphofructokinase [Anaerolineaceae bacterium]MCB9099702.1 6-phosphofructokinase [Anaerolineales bacterium]